MMGTESPRKGLHFNEYFLNQKYAASVAEYIKKQILKKRKLSQKL